ncbi:unnamed protein product, partial [Allacma fusca]
KNINIRQIPGLTPVESIQKSVL